MGVLVSSVEQKRVLLRYLEEQICQRDCDFMVGHPSQERQQQRDLPGGWHELHMGY